MDDPVVKRVALAALLLAGCAHGDDYLPRFAAAERQSRPFAPITATHADTTMAEAYRLQRRYVALRRRAGDRVAGYKGGLMSQASLAGRGVREPLVGVLFAAGSADGGATVSLCGYRRAAFELKLGHRDGQVLPVIDLPDIAYRDPDHYGAVDMVAANISAARYVRGVAQAAEGRDLDALRVTLSRDGQTIASGVSGESLGGQIASVATVRDLAVRAGYAPRPADLIVTGKIGDRGWLLSGRYVADYGALGRVAFTVAACAA
jgi:2-keto-4-pentenoate hydratase